MITGHHRGRSWTGHDLEDTCPCPKEPCGLIDTTKAAPDCTQHGRNHPPRSMRQGHAIADCPGGTDPATVLQLAYDALRHADARCPTHNLTPPDTGDCDDCAQARRIRRALNAFDVAADTKALATGHIDAIRASEHDRVAADLEARAKAIEDTHGENQDWLAEQFATNLPTLPIGGAVQDDPRTIAIEAYRGIAFILTAEIPPAPEAPEAPQAALSATESGETRHPRVSGP